MHIEIGTTAVLEIFREATRATYDGSKEYISFTGMKVNSDGKTATAAITASRPIPTHDMAVADVALVKGVMEALEVDFIVVTCVGDEPLIFDKVEDIVRELHGEDFYIHASAVARTLGKRELVEVGIRNQRGSMLYIQDEQLASATIKEQ